MTTQEFSNEFDILVNSYNSRLNEGQDLLTFDEYEKSVFLTDAQESVVKSLYNGNNVLGGSFEGSEEIRRYLNELVKDTILDDSERNNDKYGLSNLSVFFNLPSDVWFITYESVKILDDSNPCMNGKDISVIPISQDDYYKASDNPFRKSNTRRAFRLDNNLNTVEIISQYNIDTYHIRYISRPEPIILTPLPDGLSIKGKNNVTECRLNSAIHRMILGEAVNKALQSRSISIRTE